MSRDLETYLLHKIVEWACADEKSLQKRGTSLESNNCKDSRSKNVFISLFVDLKRAKTFSHQQLFGKKNEASVHR